MTFGQIKDDWPFLNLNVYTCFLMPLLNLDSLDIFLLLTQVEQIYQKAPAIYSIWFKKWESAKLLMQRNVFIVTKCLDTLSLEYRILFLREKFTKRRLSFPKKSNIFWNWLMKIKDVFWLNSDGVLGFISFSSKLLAGAQPTAVVNQWRLTFTWPGINWFCEMDTVSLILSFDCEGNFKSNRILH